MSLTNEQIKSILEDAPDGARQYNTHRHGFKYWSIKIDFATHKLSDLAEILALRERVYELERKSQDGLMIGQEVDIIDNRVKGCKAITVEVLGFGDDKYLFYDIDDDIEFAVDACHVVLATKENTNERD
jgi:hypothetical protein